MRYLILVLLMITCGILSATLRELRDYNYVYELYSRQNDNEALLEINQFLTRYPQSDYYPSIRFMQAEIYYYQARFPEAISIYEDLRYIDQEPQIKAEMLLHYGIGCFYLKNYNKALELFQVINSEYDFDNYKSEASLWMARIYAEGGFFYSAEQYYRICLETQTSNLQVKLELYSVLLNLNKMSDAERLLTTISTQSANFQLFIESLLSYYLNNELYSEFDATLRQYSIDPEQSRDSLRLLIIRRLLLENWFTEAEHYVNSISISTDQSRYYKAIIQKSKGQTIQADSLFSGLIRSNNSDVALLSYLERIKILFVDTPILAIQQLETFIQQNQGSDYLGELTYLLAYLYYQTNDYLSALRFFSRSRNYELNKYQADRIDAMTAECWFRLERWDQAEERFNRYLNLYPQGLYRDRAWFNLGVIAFKQTDYNQSRVYLRSLLNRHPQSILTKEAMFYLAELDFYQANYNFALQSYRVLMQTTSQDSGLLLRIAQCHFYNQNYTSALAAIDSLSSHSYDSYLLKANVNFALRRYSVALDGFQAAFNHTEDPVKRMEAQSYVALTLYQLGRFSEASALYLQLSGEQANPDTYLFLAAKSAMQSGSDRQAAELYERLITQYPNSSHVLAVLADLASMDYNAGRYMESFSNWMSLVTRYRSQTGFSVSERQILRNAFTGIELCMLRDSGYEMAETVIHTADTFRSDYIKFELQYILVKLYAARSQWQALLREAEIIRASADQNQRNHIEMLMAESLINLNQYSSADSLLSDLFSQTGSNSALLKRAEIQALEGNYSSAADLYLSSFQSIRSAEVWGKLLECSEKLDYERYTEYFDMGSEYFWNLGDAILIHLNYLLANAYYDELRAIAEQVLDSEYSDYIHARAYLAIAEADFALSDYQSSIRIQSRLRILFPDFVDIGRRVAYLNVLSLLRSGAVTEAQMSYWEFRHYLSDDQIEELNSIFEGFR